MDSAFIRSGHGTVAVEATELERRLCGANQVTVGRSRNKTRKFECLGELSQAEVSRVRAWGPDFTFLAGKGDDGDFQTSYRCGIIGLVCVLVNTAILVGVTSCQADPRRS